METSLGLLPMRVSYMRMACGKKRAIALVLNVVDIVVNAFIEQPSPCT